MEQSSNSLEDKLVLVPTKEDPTRDGKFRRILVGTKGEAISGAIYVDPSQTLPKAIILAIPQIGGKSESVK